MKVTGIVLMIAGVLMLIFTNINFTTEKKVVDIGPLEINKKENNSVGWPSWVGGVGVLVGIALLVGDRKRG